MRGAREGGTKFTSPSAKPTGTPSPKVKPRSEPCPDCKAEVDQPCRNTDGEVRKEAHRARVRIATRRLNERREAAGTLDVRFVPERTVGNAESDDGVVCRACGLRVLYKPDGTIVGHTVTGSLSRSQRTQCPGSLVVVDPPAVLVVHGRGVTYGLRLSMNDETVGHIENEPLTTASRIRLTLGEHDGFTEHPTLTEAIEVARLALGAAKTLRRRDHLHAR